MLAQLPKLNDMTDSKAPLITLAQQRADVRPLFVAPTISGRSRDYSHLAEQLNDTVPVYGLQMRGLAGGDKVYDNLRDAAEYHIERMREIQPEGPYSLAGYSAGGTICLAIAEALHDQGETVDLMLMLDAVPLGIEIASPLGSPRRLWRWGCAVVGRIAELYAEGDFFLSMIKRSKSVTLRLWTKIWPFAKKHKIDVRDLFTQSSSSDLPADEAARVQTHLDTILNFQPRRLPLNVVLIRGRYDQLEGSFELDLGWNLAVTGDIQVEVISLQHHQFLFKNRVQLLAEKMKAHLNARVSTSRAFD